MNPAGWKLLDLLPLRAPTAIEQPGIYRCLECFPTTMTCQVSSHA